MDCRIRQTATASPAEPGGLPLTLAKRVALIPFQAEEPVGVERLSFLAAGMTNRRVAFPQERIP